ncbi:MAG TPA: FmdB family zinc ribbon protein [Solirubrobacterales bacterium]|nr:FmdB family zinc ribbon protein [Solirubrobacterales bacterium]
MPIYEYKCENGHVFEVLQKMVDEPLHECEVCGAPAARVLTAPAIHFKGSGFHNTDYGTRKSGGNGASESSSESKSSDSGPSESKSDSGKSESKPAASAAD